MNMEFHFLSTTEISKDISFHLGSSYKSASVTRRKDTVKETVLIENELLPYPFRLLNVVKSKGSSGKCWVFHRNYNGEFVGFFFPSGYRILGKKTCVKKTGEFFLENRNFQSSRNGLLGAILPKNPKVGHINKCELILTRKLTKDKMGEMKLTYLKFSESNLRSNESLIILQDKGKLKDYFSSEVSTSVNSLNITYMNSMESLSFDKGGYQMSLVGPDNFVIENNMIENHIRLEWKQKLICSSLTGKRKHTRDMLPRRLANSLYKTNICIIAETELKSSYVHDMATKFFLIPYDIGTDFVRFATISQKQYNYLKYLSEQHEEGFNKSDYESVLDGFLQDNSKEILDIYIFFRT